MLITAASFGHVLLIIGICIVGAIFAVLRWMNIQRRNRDR
jgi:mannose/fructose/N-acetylgalactosamine-specific phosphotransferase system component IIC